MLPNGDASIVHCQPAEYPVDRLAAGCGLAQTSGLPRFRCANAADPAPSNRRRALKPPLRDARPLRPVAALATACTAPLLVAIAAPATAQSYPARPIRMIVPFAPGGPTDVVGRIVAQKLTDTLGQQVVVDNRAGAGGNIGMGLAAHSVPDGHTLLMVSSSFVVNPGLYEKIPYDPVKSFRPISNLAAAPNIYIAHPSVPAQGVADIVKLAQANPKKYSYGTPGIGTTPDLAAALFRFTTKIDIAAVPFNGAGPAIAAVVANQLPFGCVAMPGAAPHVKGGRLRGLAVTSAKRSSTFPEIPTMAEAGFANQESDTLQGLLVPTGTPAVIAERLYRDAMKVLQMPDARDRITSIGFDIVATTPAEFAAQIRAEVAKWTRVVKDAGIKVE
jgi:tripartite-type tricarboxylate transporter receptor subunit TctC